jgi:hypothetical protein
MVQRSESGGSTPKPRAGGQPAASIEELLQLVRQKGLAKSRFKRLVLKAIRDIPGHERNQIRRELAVRLGFRNWKELSDNWPHLGG